MATAERVAIRQAEAAESQAAALESQNKRLAALEKSTADLHGKLDSLIGFLMPSEPVEDDKGKAKK